MDDGVPRPLIPIKAPVADLAVVVSHIRVMSDEQCPEPLEHLGAVGMRCQILCDPQRPLFAAECLMCPCQSSTLECFVVLRLKRLYLTTVVPTEEGHHSRQYTVYDECPYAGPFPSCSSSKGSGRFVWGKRHGSGGGGTVTVYAGSVHAR